MEKNALILEALKAVAPVNFSKAEAIAEKFDAKVKSVIAIATRNGVAYERKPRLNKAGNVSFSKETLVEDIARAVGLEASDLSGLEKASKASLEKLVVAVTILVKMLDDLDAELGENNE